MSIDILNRYTRAVIYHSETATTIAEAVVEAIKNRASLNDASLNGANLNGANLNGANLNRASLIGASLDDASLDDANLNGASLNGANLNGANLNRANLNRANLNGANLNGANLNRASLIGASLIGASLNDANLNDANLNGASLIGASLNGANLNGANLNRASLIDASLNGASLNDANLNGANLNGARGINKFFTTPLYLLRDQPGKIRAYKLVNADAEGPFSRAQGYGGITYRIGESYELPDADTDESIQCAAGISLATLDWCMREWRSGYRILIAEFEAADIAAIPTGSDGKFRVYRCVIVGEKDLAEIGLMMQPGVKGDKT